MNIINSSHRKSFKNVMTFEKLIQRTLSKKYCPRNKSLLKYKYIGLIMENLIFNKNTHEVTTFKDFMIWDYIEEFLKRFYLKKESVQRVPKFAVFYKNYLQFFCIPTLKDTFINEVVHTCSEKKAELFYNENYRRKKKEDSELKDCGIYQDTESDMSESKSDNQSLSKKIFFNETARKKIERNSPINTSMVLNESETKIKDDESGLLVTASELDSYNENSLRDIITGMKKKKKTLNINNQKLTLYANDYISSKMINKNPNKNQNKNGRNKSLDILSNNNNINNNINNNKSKQLTTYNVVSSNDKKKEKIKNNNYIMNKNDSNQINKRNNNSNLFTSLNSNYTRNRSQNQQLISMINSNTYTKNNNLEKISNIKQTINLNLLKGKNIQNIFGKYNPTIYINSKNEKKPKNYNKNINNKESITNSAKSIFMKNNDNNIKMSSNKYFLKNSSYSQVKLPKASNIKAKNTARILSYKDFHKSENESIKKNRNKNIINAKLSFDGILRNNNNNNKRYNIINYNGDKHIHNINININNNINIGPKQFQEIFTFSDLLKKQNKKMSKIVNNNNNNIYAFLKSNNNKNMNYISRNKNQNMDLNSIINNTNNNNKMNSATDIHNSLGKNSIYKTQYIINKGKNDIIYDFKHKKTNRMKFNNENILRSLKAKI